MSRLLTWLKKNLEYVFVLPVLLLSAGIRLRDFLANRALWLDEATLGLNIIKRSYAELLEPLDTLQVAPIGFLMVERFFVELLGPGEQALRLLPFLAGILSVWLFYDVTKRLASVRIGLIASIMFAFSYYLIYYSVEVKQYMLDVFFMLLIARYVLIPCREKISFLRYLIPALIGAIAIWFSNVSELILASVGIWLAVVTVKRNYLPGILGFLFMGMFWLSSFAVYYWFFIRNHPYGDLQVEAFQSINYLPGVPGFLGTVKWMLQNLGGLFEYSIGKTGGVIGSILSIIALYFIVRRKDYLLLALFLPVLIHLALSLFSIYPFGRRFTLYAIPVVFIFISYGLYHLFLSPVKITRSLIPVILFIMIFDHAKLSRHPIQKQEIRGPMEYIGKNYQEGDIIYVQYGSRWAFEYYHERFIPEHCIIMPGTWIRTQPEAWDRELDSLKHYDRIWLLFSNYYPSELEMVIEGVGSWGELSDIKESFGASAYLFENVQKLN